MGSPLPPRRRINLGATLSGRCDGEAEGAQSADFLNLKCIWQRNRLLVLVLKTKPRQRNRQMQLKTILNRRYPLKRFVYGNANFVKDRTTVD